RYLYSIPKDGHQADRSSLRPIRIGCSDCTRDKHAESRCHASAISRRSFDRLSSYMTLREQYVPVERKRTILRRVLSPEVLRGDLRDTPCWASGSDAKKAAVSCLSSFLSVLLVGRQGKRSISLPNHC